jgi:hypothetical protein
VADRTPTPEVLFALAETSFWLGTRAPARDRGVFDYYCLGYAYHYVVAASAPTPPPSAGGIVNAEGRTHPTAPVALYDPYFRLGCELYNAALTRWLRSAAPKGKLEPGPALSVPVLARPDDKPTPRVLPVHYHGFPWTAEELGPLTFSADLSTVGLENRYRTYGLGVPLFGVRRGEAKEKLYLPGASFPVTAVARFEGGVGEVSRRRSGRLEMVNPLAEPRPGRAGDGLRLVSLGGQAAVELSGRAVPLECDLTTPLTYFLHNTALREFDYEGFVNSDRLQPENGIYLMEPYQPGKIPVLLVHGLLSSPVTWMPMYNDLRADPAIRSRFQFWFFLYTTGTPYLQSAADLREALARTRERLDPEHRDPALDQMVCVTHSMGGLLSKLQVIDSGDDFWQLVSPEPFDQVKAQPATRELLRRSLFFHGRPEVRRVVFIGTPHRGSKLSPSLVGRFAARFVRLPRTLRDTAKDLLEENPQLKLSELPTSVDLLAPNNPALLLLASRPAPPGVHFHSVIGDAPCHSALRYVTAVFNPSRGPTDGVVPYSSAHLDGVDSELIVRADHLTIHQHPLTVQEVRRILKEHLAAMESESGGVNFRPAP